MPILSIKRLDFQAGVRPGAPPVTIQNPRVVLLVGPNSSGKSLALREIEAICLNQNPSLKVIRDFAVEFQGSAADASVELAPYLRQGPDAQGVSMYGRIQTLGSEFNVGFDAANLGVILGDAPPQMRARQHLLPLFVLRLDGRTRFHLTNTQEAEDLQGPPHSHLGKLFRDDAARQKVRQLTSEAFGKHFVIDPTGMRIIRIRLSDSPPPSNEIERGLSKESIAFHQAAQPIEAASDGVQAFTGLLAAVMTMPQKILLIDEPEAFLHPPLSRRLGDELATITEERGATAVIATHSADFLMGVLLGTANATIVRLTYDAGRGSARVLTSDELEDLLRDPLLRSTGALQGLFHRAVVVTEADADRAFYDEANRRLREVGRGVDDALFVNAQNWQTTARVAGPLRKLGIPAAVILDFDAITEASGWFGLYDIMGLTPKERSSMEAERSWAENLLKSLPLDSSGEKLFKLKGLSAVSGTDKARMGSLLANLGARGVFIVPVGELERWLPQLGITVSKKSEWIVRMFEAMGHDPTAPSYVAASTGDVWRFLDGVADWVRNPSRGGT